MSTPNDLTFGIRLARARAEKGLSVDDIAQRLNILKRHVIALEQENFEELPQFAFAKGFAINYAKLLKLDTNELGALFEARYPTHLRPKSATELQSPIQPMGTLHRSKTRPKINIWLILAVIGVLILAVMIFKTINAAKTPQSPQIAQEFTPSEQALGAGVDGLPPLPALPASGALPNAQLPALPSNTAPNAQTGELDFWVSNKKGVNIEVKDASGQVLMTGKQERGPYLVHGQMPLSITISPAEGVSLNFNKDKVDLKAYTNADGVATFRLPSAP